MSNERTFERVVAALLADPKIKKMLPNPKKESAEVFATVVLKATYPHLLPDPDVSNPEAAIASLDADLDQLADKVTSAAAATDDEQYRKGLEVHGRLKRAKRELDAIEATGADASDVKVKLKHLTDRLLREVFNYIDG